jgi:hypothetical protein
MRSSELELTAWNAVVVARQFNPTVFSQLWLVEYGFVEKDGFRKESMFADAVAKIETDRFAMVVVPPQLQFSPRNVSDSDALGILGRMVATVPHTPYVAAGVNFTFTLASPQSETTEGFSRRLFGNSNALSGSFDSPDALFGTYASRDVEGCRLKIDVKPQRDPAGPDGGVRLQASVNFHRDAEKDATVVSAHVQQWARFREIAEEALRELER